MQLEEEHFDRLSAALRLAPAPTPDLVRALIAAACTRLPNLASGESRRIERLIEAGAWIDAALAVVACELPRWSLRRLARDDDEWHCALSRQPELPEALDDVAHGHHTTAALAIFDAFVEARRGTPHAASTRTVPMVRPAATHAVCCDNFS